MRRRLKLAASTMAGRSAGDKLFCSEAYVDGAAANVHLEAALPIVGAMIESGAVSVDSVEFHGPVKEWAAVKENADGVGTIYYDVDVSFSPSLQCPHGD